MSELDLLLENNHIWQQKRLEQDPLFFAKQSASQSPNYLWIGCADSRVPANEIVGLEPGELFVHRNVANVVPHTDVNCLSVLQYGVDCLGIKQIIVCGHYNCGGIAAAMKNQQHGIVDNWLRHIRDVYSQFKEELNDIRDFSERQDRLAELNVLQQVMNVCHTTIIQNAWARKQPVAVHGCIYDLETGQLHDLDCCVTSDEQIEQIYVTRLKG